MIIHVTMDRDYAVNKVVCVATAMREDGEERAVRHELSDEALLFEANFIIEMIKSVTQKVFMAEERSTGLKFV